MHFLLIYHQNCIVDSNPVCLPFDRLYAHCCTIRPLASEILTVVNSALTNSFVGKLTIFQFKVTLTFNSVTILYCSFYCMCCWLTIISKILGIINVVEGFYGRVLSFGGRYATFTGVWRISRITDTVSGLYGRVSSFAGLNATFTDDYEEEVYYTRKAVGCWSESFPNKEIAEKWNIGWKEGEEITRREANRTPAEGHLRTSKRKRGGSENSGEMLDLSS